MCDAISTESITFLLRAIKVAAQKICIDDYKVNFNVATGRKLSSLLKFQKTHDNDVFTR